MNWIIFALIAMFGWGFADIFYKKGADEDDRYSHLKVAIWVGIVLGIMALVLIPFSETLFSVDSERSFFENVVCYFPASLSYIISMVIGYAGMRYLEISIISPVQNSSGVISSLVILFGLVFLNSSEESFSDVFSFPYILAMVLILVGIVALAFVENNLALKSVGTEEKKKYRFGALALLFPILYCVFDSIGTAADGIILDEESGLGIGEIDVLILYGFTFFVVGIFCWLFLLIKTKKAYNPFMKKEWPKAVASCCEGFGQVFYVYAMAANAAYAAPVISSYCIVSLILSRVLLKEKLKLKQYLCIMLIVIGIVILGFLDA